MFGAASSASLIAGLAALAPAIFGWFLLAVTVVCVLAFMLWSAWDSGYDTGWMDHSEGVTRA